MPLDPSVAAFHRAMAHKAMEVLARRNIDCHYVTTGKEAVELALGMIPDDAQVMAGSSTTMYEIGLEDALKAATRFDYMRTRVRGHADARLRNEARRHSTVADVFLGGVNAVCLTGELVSADASGNRVAGYAYGGKRVIMVAGVNKLVHTLEEGIARVRHAAVQEAFRLDKHPPCLPDGICRNHECEPPHRECAKMLIIEADEPGRTSLVLIEDFLGF
ncbi:MAG TPA: lactate utilization protein [Chloroflexota bacterium]|nr:lactate utilization protein [Chloroflexota bacterium]